MNAKLLYAVTVAIALLASTAAMASDASQFSAGPSTRSRAEVRAELAAARAAGQLDQRGDSHGAVQPASRSTLTRAEVLADAARARAEAGRGVSERDYGYPEPPAAATRSRAEVRAEARQAALARFATPKLGD